MKNPVVQILKAVAQRHEPPRSARWPAARRIHLAKEGWCRSCGSVKDLEVHHIQPFHLEPKRELDQRNLITLCEGIGRQCHLKRGHLGNWRNFNPHVLMDCTAPKS